MRLAFMKDVDGFALEVRTAANVALPGEPTRHLIRMNLEPDATGSQSLLGQWVLFDGTVLLLDRDLGTEASAADGSASCKRAPQKYAPHLVSCQWKQTVGDKIIWQASSFNMEPNNRSLTIWQVRDRHGNLMGLGNVPLD